MKINGWNQTPNGYISSFDFSNAPSYLKFLAYLPFFERFAYPIAIRQGYGTLWPHPYDRRKANREALLGWVVRNEEMPIQEKIGCGAMSFIQPLTFRGLFLRYFVYSFAWTRESKRIVRLRMNGF